MRKLFLVVMLLSASVFAYGQMMTKDGPAAVGVPELPVYLDFAGEKVPLELPDVRQAVEREVITTCNMHTSTILTLLRSTRWIPVIRPILKKNGIPEDFIYLCLAESGMNPEVISPAKAAGLWQFTVGAAKKHGLETGSNVDLRYNIEEATEAACRYLKESYDSLGSWTLAAACYNIGNNGIIRRLALQDVNNYWDMYLPEETLRYVPRILSFKILLSNPAKYGFDIKPEDYFKPFENYFLISINDTHIDWCQLANSYGSCFKMLRLLNPWIREYVYENRNGRSYTVKIPTAEFRTKGY